MTTPLNALGLDYPCKGYLSDLGTPNGEPTASYVAGGVYWFGMGRGYGQGIGGGREPGGLKQGEFGQGGGSCQVSLSIDKGTTFKVLHSYIGNCLFYDLVTTAYYFHIPSDVPPGPAIFAWTWFNKIGTPKMYMNCASITIMPKTSNNNAAFDAMTLEYAPRVAFASLPDIFVANIGNNCTTANSFNVNFPDPGPNRERYYDPKDPIRLCSPMARSIGQPCIHAQVLTSRDSARIIEFRNLLLNLEGGLIIRDPS